MQAAAKLLVGALGVLVALGVAIELLSPRPPARSPGIGRSDVPAALVQPHARRGYELPASAEVEYAGVRTRLNAQGLRGPWPEAGQRVAVLALGDEVTFGWGVEDGRTYPEQLEALIRRECPDCGRVVNAGVPGYTSYQGLMLLQQLAPVLRPRVVVAAFHLNDALLDGPLVRLTAALEDEGDGSLERWLRERSAIYRWARGRGGSPVGGWSDVEPRTAVNAYGRNVQAICSGSKRAGAEVVVLNIGYAPGLPDAPRRLRRGLLEDDYHAAARDVAAAEGARLVEITSGELVPGDMLDAVHPSAQGQARIASALAQLVSRDGLLAPAAR